jgi:hypothetical protein
VLALTVAFFSTYAFAGTTEDDELARILGTPMSPQAPCPAPEVNLGPAEDRDFRRDRVAYAVCGSDAFEAGAAVCEQAITACKQRNLSADLQGTCSNVSDERYQAERNASAKLKDKILTATKKFFSDTITNPRAAALCCGEGNDDNQRKCIQAFKAVKLKIVACRNNSCNGEYKYAEKTVEIADKRLMRSLSRENMEQLVLHELGHACMASRHASNYEEFRTLTLDGCVEASGRLAEADIEGVYGPGVLNCVRDQLNYHKQTFLEESGKKACASDWLRETFAYSVFYPLREGSVTYWAWDCNGQADVSHPKPRWVNGCFLEHERVKSVVCPGRAGAVATK